MASLSLSLKPNHHHHHPATIKPKPRSLRPKLCDFFRFSFSWLIEAETQTHSSKNPRLIGAKVDQTHSSRSRRQRRGPTKSEWEKKRLIRPIEVGWKEEANEEVDQTIKAESEWGVREKEKRSRDKREKKMRKTETNRDKREKKN